MDDAEVIRGSVSNHRDSTVLMLLMEEKTKPVKSVPIEHVQETAEFYYPGQSLSIIMVRAAECITVCQKQELF